MKTWQSKIKTLGATALMLCVFAWTGASAQIAGTKHNLGTSGPAGQNQFSGTGEICVFCHTPHGGDASPGAEVPLWNRTLALPSSYETYQTVNGTQIRTSLDGEVADVGSVSIACLSCHDGTQAMDTLLNDPGSGADVPAFSGGTWTGPNQTLGSITGIANLGQNLQNDHPIGIQYAGGGYTVGATAGPGTDPDFHPADSAPVNGTTVWWVDTEATPDGVRQKTDMQLYTRSVAAIDTGTAQPFVECASCHDPHTAEATFLRVSNAGSNVCLACHNK